MTIRPLAAACLLLASAEVSAQTPSPIDETARSPRPYVDGALAPEGEAGLVWQHRAWRDTAFWFMNGETMVASSRFSPGATIAGDPDWELRAVADMNGDRHGDVIWQHATSGELRVSLLVGSTRVGTRAVLALNGGTAEADLDWKVVGAADLNRDGQTDLLWRHRSSGALRIWHMTQTTQLNSAEIAQPPAAAGWDVAGLSDMDGDGWTDIIWRHTALDRTAVWLMYDTRLRATPFLTGPALDPGWRLAAVADVNRDGHADLVWQHGGSGQLALWYLRRLSFVRTVSIAPSVAADPEWEIAGVSVTRSSAPTGARDFSGDGSPDVVWRNPATGRNALWTMDREALQASSPFSAGADLVIDLGWEIRALGDMNGDGKGDVIWQHSPSGQIGVWMFAGATRTGAALFETLSGISVEPDPDWKIVGAADMNADHQTDILWRHLGSGALRVWHMNGIDQLDSVDLSTGVVDPLWQVAGLADMNRDGWTDIVWRHAGDGRLAAWLMTGTIVRSTPPLTPGTVPDLQWRIAGVADINRDGHPDLVWQHCTTGQLSVWYMSGVRAVTHGSLGPGSINDPNWRIVGVR